VIEFTPAILSRYSVATVIVILSDARIDVRQDNIELAPVANDEGTRLLTCAIETRGVGIA